MRVGSFSVDSGAYAGVLFRLYLRRMWWIYALPAAALVAAGVADIRFLFLAVIYIFLVIPMVMGFALTAYGLVGESRYSILPKTLDADQAGLHFTFLDEDGAETSRSSVEWSEVSRVSPTRKNLVLCLRRGGFRFIVIPYTAFSGGDGLRLFMELARAAGVRVE